MKICKKCGVEHPLTEFYRNKTYADGHDSTCKECKRAYQRTRPAHDLEYMRAYTEANRERINELSREWYAKNPERGKANRKRWADKQPREYHSKRVSEWIKRNPEYNRSRASIRRARVAGAITQPMPTNFLELVKDYYGQCLYPGCGSTERLEVDHVIALSRGGSHVYWNFQVLCKSHNCRKYVNDVDYRNGNIYYGPKALEGVTT